MMKIIRLAVVAFAGLCGATSAFAQVMNENPMGLDYGPFHPPVPAQVTTYYPPAPVAVAHRGHYRVHRPSY